MLKETLNAQGADTKEKNRKKLKDKNVNLSIKPNDFMLIVFYNS